MIKSFYLMNLKIEACLLSYHQNIYTFLSLLELYNTLIHSHLSLMVNHFIIIMCNRDNLMCSYQLVFIFPYSYHYIIIRLIKRDNLQIAFNYNDYY